jgi:parallel beta-helix repeat protein
MKRSISLFVALAMVLSLFAGVGTPTAKAAAVWYVGKSDATDAVGHGTSVSHPFLTIQYAVTTAAAGDIINVAAGTYTENVTVNKALTLTGSSAIVNPAAADHSIFTVTASGVSISGFTASGAIYSVHANESGAGIYLAPGVANCTIYNNTLTGNLFGALLVDVEDSIAVGNNTFTNNTVSSNLVSGIEMQHTYGNTFTNNTASSNGTSTSSGYGFKLDSSRHNTFTGNTANSNLSMGFNLATGAGVGSNDNTFTNNTMTGNAIYGMRISGSTGNTLTGNTISTDTTDGVGIKLNNSTTDVTTNFTATGNTITTSLWGIEIVGALSNVLINENTITGNTHYVHHDGTGALDATHNWWGLKVLATITAAIQGTGSANVTYKPYYTTLDLGHTSGILSNITTITSFNLTASPTAATGTVNNTLHTVALAVPHGTVVTAYVTAIALTDATNSAISPASGVSTDFTLPVTYTVTAIDGTTQAYIALLPRTLLASSTKPLIRLS